MPCFRVVYYAVLYHYPNKFADLMIRQIIKPLLLVALLFFLACQGPSRQEDTFEVDFSEPDSPDGIETKVRDSGILRVAISTVISPRESFIYYEEMFAAMAAHLDLRVDFIQRTTYGEVTELLATNQVDMAFICSGAYIDGSDHHELMFVPVIDGITTYRGYIITQDNAPMQRFEDFAGKTFTYSDPMCFTGSIFVDRRLLDFDTDVDDFFGEVVYSYSHDLSIQMVSRQIVDGAAVNGLIFEYIRKHQPDLVDNIRIIEKTIPGGIPPVVNSLLMDRQLRADIQQFFLEMHQQDSTLAILDELLIDKFVIASDSIYDGLREIQSALVQ